MASITKLSNGNYRIVVSDGYDIHGKQKRYSKNWKPPIGLSAKQQKKAAYTVAAQFEEECKSGYHSPERKMKFEAFAEEWFRMIAPKKYKARTILEYRRYAKCAYLEFGHLPLIRITPRVIQNYITQLESEINPATGRKMSAKTIKNYVFWVSSVLSYAVLIQAIRINPCATVFFPKHTKKDALIFTQQQANQFLKMLYETPTPTKYKVFFTLAIFNGFREGELLGLRWKDIDFKQGIITINQQLLYLKKDGQHTLHFDSPKTKSSKRSIRQPEFILSLLRYHYLEQLIAKERFQEEWTNQGYLFTAVSGKPLIPNAPYRWLKGFLKKHNLPPVNIHSLRHYCACTLITKGMDVKTVSDFLGHTSPTTTLSVYAHSFLESRAIATQVITDHLSEGITSLNALQTPNKH